MINNSKHSGGLVTTLCLTLVTPWTIAHQVLLFMGLEFSRQEYWSGLPFPSPGDLPDPGIEPWSALQAGSLPTEPLGKPNWPLYSGFCIQIQPTLERMVKQNQGYGRLTILHHFR